MKQLFNFYLENKDKQEAQDKLTRLCGEQSKGQLAALCRTMIKDFLSMPDEECVELVKRLETEYEYTKCKNKRSLM